MRLRRACVTIACALGLFQASFAPCAGNLTCKADDWTPLFDGKSFAGWDTVLESSGKNADPDRIFQVEDGVIHLYRDQPDGTKTSKGYFVSKDEYSYFHLRFKYKWGTKKYPTRYNLPRDAGLLYHAEGSSTVWPRSIECQVQEGDTGDCLTVRGSQLRTTINPATASRWEYTFQTAALGGQERTIGDPKNVRIIKESMHEVDGWNTVEVIVQGDQATTHIVNGHVVFQAKDLRQLEAGTKKWIPLTQGKLAFQAELAEVFYKDIEVRPIPEGPLHPNPTAALPRVPDGFEITQVAAPPLVEYPTLACFDDKGRLYVSEGANINGTYEEISKTLPRSIRRLEDTNGDGVFDKSTVFADKMTFPYGGVWHDGALYVASDPSIWRLEDLDDDGVADKRDEFLGRFGSEGHASCVKGGYLGPDGWLYFCGGNERNGYDLTGKDGTNLKDPRIAPCVFRIRPDGRGLEYFANGAAGVYDLCFDPSGDLFGIVTILRYPRGDGLMHWTYGGAYETSRSPSRYAQLTGDRLPALKEWPQTSPSGAMRYESGALGEDYVGNIFTAHFNTHVITRSVLERDGGTWKPVAEEPFVTSDELNCRFTDVLEDADGSLLAVNTGGWFRIGCPTSQVSEKDLRGGIYRIRKVGQKKPDDPRGLKIDWRGSSVRELANLLDDPRWTVREQAIAGLAGRGTQGVKTLQSVLQSGSTLGRRNAIWALTRIDGSEARAAVREALSDADMTNQLAALHSVGLHRDEAAFNQVRLLMRSEVSALRRGSAAALGRLGKPAAVPELLKALEATTDRFTEHAVIFALIEIKSRDQTLAGLKSSNPRVARGALIALDQMPDGRLTEEDVAPLLQSDDTALLKASLSTIGRHKGWNKGIETFLTRWLQRREVTEEQRAILATALRSAIGSRSVQNLLGLTLSDKDTPLPLRLVLIDVIASSKLREYPKAWREPLERCLQSPDESIMRHAISAMVNSRKAVFDDALTTLTMDSQRPLSLRIAAANALVEGRRPPADAPFNFLLDQCALEETAAVDRLTISKTLGNASLSPAQLERMTKLIAVAGPLELPSLLRSYEESPEGVAGAALCAALVSAPGAESLSAIRLQKLVDRYDPSVQKLVEPLLKRLNQDAAVQTARMEELKPTLEGGDPNHGRTLFFGKAVCVQCHRIGKQGNGVGPDLSQIGSIRTRRDLLESIVLPSATLARGYEPVTVIVSGKPISGILRHETADEVFLLTADRSETAIPRAEIDEIVPSRISIMPQGLDRNLTPEELRDLLAFLSTLGTGSQASTP